MILFKNVSKIYSPNIVALDNINLKIKNGEFVSIVGQSGAGKTTLLKLLIAEEKPTQGKVLINKKNISKIKTRHLPIFRQQIGAVFQDIRLLPRKTSFENIAFVMEVVGKTQAEIENEVPEILSIVGLGNKANCFPYQLAGGEKQRICLARALAHKPEILIADEPTGNLDLLNTWDIIQLLLKIHQFGTTIILATHNKDIVNNINKRVITLDHGRIIRDQEKGEYLL
ncbi:MAG: cell division ATP-binding protein FtsE [Candidatus Portnoybacteria bacterium CG23_combo_of_CG06-09_8_20_14_all_37_13]|uniref:Cell division ATP-binding protein FtsE n=1 Tax=Candidatus Portnoybacteria bacterium CG23_combo_of_CG06-09_8_20_14_all_37_13 TaxID=1974819 RepID=A0A2G9YDI8_9BACT|nr:MAG: cell division ATP-binding protein FtsE [Candidatus Portnoybacteria bacterium CG23_combo_of_CG06-09_8_20_14_all_37_13]